MLGISYGVWQIGGSITTFVLYPQIFDGEFRQVLIETIFLLYFHSTLRILENSNHFQFHEPTTSDNDYTLHPAPSFDVVYC